jgi:hypothetical protein
MLLAAFSIGAFAGGGGEVELNHAGSKVALTWDGATLSVPGYVRTGALETAEVKLAALKASAVSARAEEANRRALTEQELEATLAGVVERITGIERGIGQAAPTATVATAAAAAIVTARANCGTMNVNYWDRAKQTCTPCLPNCGTGFYRTGCGNDFGGLCGRCACRLGEKGRFTSNGKVNGDPNSCGMDCNNGRCYQYGTRGGPVCVGKCSRICQYIAGAPY